MAVHGPREAAVLGQLQGALQASIVVGRATLTGYAHFEPGDPSEASNTALMQLLSRQTLALMMKGLLRPVLRMLGSGGR